MRSVLKMHSYQHQHNASLQVPYHHAFRLPFEGGFNEAKILAWFDANWPHTITLGVCYLALVYSIRVLMARRAPFDLRGPLFVWNAALAAFSILGAIRTSEEFVHTLAYGGYYKSICYSMDARSVTAYWQFYFAVSKVFELFDTVFLVLRKRPLTFLHCYHHASVMIYTFQSAAEHLAAGRYFIWMNLIAHSFMYTYYAAMSRGIKVPRAIAKCVTLLQLAQMFVGLGVSISVAVVKFKLNLPCRQSSTNLTLALIIYASYALLFLNYFYQTYTRSTNKSTINKKTQ